MIKLGVHEQQHAVAATAQARKKVRYVPHEKRVCRVGIQRGVNKRAAWQSTPVFKFAAAGSIHGMMMDRVNGAGGGERKDRAGRRAPHAGYKQSVAAVLLL